MEGGRGGKEEGTGRERGREGEEERKGQGRERGREEEGAKKGEWKEEGTGEETEVALYPVPIFISTFVQTCWYGNCN